MMRRTPRSTLLPYTTLFRSIIGGRPGGHVVCARSYECKCCGHLECAAIQTVLVCAQWCSEDHDCSRNNSCHLPSDRCCLCNRHNRHCINYQWCWCRDASIIG